MCCVRKIDSERYDVRRRNTHVIFGGDSRPKRRIDIFTVVQTMRVGDKYTLYSVNLILYLSFGFFSTIETRQNGAKAIRFRETTPRAAFERVGQGRRGTELFYLSSPIRFPGTA